MTFFWGNKRTDEEIREQRNTPLGLPVVICVFLCVSLSVSLCVFLSPSSLFPPHPLTSEAGLQKSTDIHQHLDREGFAGVTYVLFTFRGVLLEHLCDFWLWSLSSDDAEQRGKMISIQDSASRAKSGVLSGLCYIKNPAQRHFSFGINLNLSPQHHHPAATPPPSTYIYTHKSNGLYQCLLEIVPWDLKKRVCGIVPYT